MLILFVVLIIITALILGLIVLIQNPKGGGLSGTFGGFGNQIMGVKQTTDALEKGTWIFAGVLGVLCTLSTVFIPRDTNASGGDDLLQNISTKGAPQAPASTPANTVPLPADSNSK